MSAGIPVRLLNEAQGHIISIELINGDTYRGKLLENEDNMNLSLYEATITQGIGESKSYGPSVYKRSMIRFISV